MLIEYLKDDVDILVVLFLGELCLRVFVLVWPNSSYERFQNIFHEIFLSSSAEKSWNERVVYLNIFLRRILAIEDFSEWWKKFAYLIFLHSLKSAKFSINMVNISHTDIYFRFLSFYSIFNEKCVTWGKIWNIEPCWLILLVSAVNFLWENVFCKNAQKCPTW